MDYYHFFKDNKPEFSLEKIPPPIDCDNIIELLDQAKFQVQSAWNDYMVNLFNDLPSSTEKEKLFFIFQSETSLRDILQKEKFRELEMLRVVGESKIWQEIVCAISERESSTVRLAKIWLDKLSESQLEKLALSKSEINLFLDLSLSTQPYIDAAYIHQIDLADLPGGKDFGEHASDEGYEYLYNDNTPYIDIFKEEFTGLSQVLNIMASRIEIEIESGDLPDKYRRLSHYLLSLSLGYTSPETNVEKILEIWERIDEQYIDLALSDCPIILTPWGFTVDGNRVGIELMVTLNLGTSSYWYKDSQIYRGLVNNFMKNYEPDFEAVPFIHQYVFVRNGINIPWTGTACAGDRYVVFYDNENNNFSTNLYDSYYRKYIDCNTSEIRFAHVRGLNTVAHEAGHLGRMIDEDMYKKMGIGIHLNKLDEAKADTMACLLFSEQIKQFGSEITPTEFIEQYIVDYIDEIRGARGHEEEDIGIIWYDFSAKLLLLLLFESGSIIWSGNRVKIVDGDTGLEALKQMGQHIFVLYGDDAFDEQEAKSFVKEIETRVSNNQDLQKFISEVTLFQH